MSGQISEPPEPPPVPVDEVVLLLDDEVVVEAPPEPPPATDVVIVVDVVPAPLLPEVVLLATPEDVPLVMLLEPASTSSALSY